MIHKWKKKIELDVGTAICGDPQPLPHEGRRKYLRCPLCFESCGDSYWERYHSKYLHLQCPLCLHWFCKPQGLSMHLSRSQCGFDILKALDHIEEKGRTIVIKIG